MRLTSGFRGALALAVGVAFTARHRKNRAQFPKVSGISNEPESEGTPRLARAPVLTPYEDLAG